HVEPQQRVAAHEASAQQYESRVRAGMDEGDITHFQEARTRPFMPEERRSAGHITADRDGPDSQLIPRQQIAGETQQQRQNKQDDADPPIEFSGWLVTAGEEDAIHVQPDRDDHSMRAPTMQLAEDTERGHIAEDEDVVVGVFERRPIVKHQQHAGHGQFQEHEERQSAHAPGVAERDPALAHRHRMQMQEDVGEHDNNTVAPIARGRVAEDALPDLRITNEITDRHGWLLTPLSAVRYPLSAKQTVMCLADSG